MIVTTMAWFLTGFLMGVAVIEVIVCIVLHASDKKTTDEKSVKKFIEKEGEEKNEQ